MGCGNYMKSKFQCLQMKLYWHTALAIHLYIVCDFCCAAVAELSSFHRNSRVHDSKLFTFWILTENLPIFHLENMLLVLLPLSIYLGRNTRSVNLHTTLVSLLTILHDYMRNQCDSFLKFLISLTCVIKIKSKCSLHSCLSCTFQLIRMNGKRSCKTH